MGRIHSIVCGVAACLFLTGSWPEASGEPAGGAGAPHMLLASESMVGVVLYPDGITPVPDLDIHVWSVTRERFVYRTRTDKDGGFEIPWLREGRAYILVGNVKIDLQVVARDGEAKAQRHDVVVVLPRRMLVGSEGPRMADVLAAPVLMTVPLLPALISP